MPGSPRLAVIITALPLEREAVQQHLRNIGPEPEHRGSIYRRGIFDVRSEPWDVVVAEIGAGNANSAAEAVRIIDHYSPQVALFIGIAGALKDVTHGDVVASTKVYQYESGKDEADFKARPAVQLADYRLEKRAQYEAGEPDWRKRIKGESPPEAQVPSAKVAPIAVGEKVVGSVAVGTVLANCPPHRSGRVKQSTPPVTLDAEAFPRIGLPALLRLSRWLQARQESPSGGTPCVSPPSLCPPASEPAGGPCRPKPTLVDATGGATQSHLHGSQPDRGPASEATSESTGGEA